MANHKRGWGFLDRRLHGYDQKYTRNVADWPPFPAAELNTRDSDGVGNIIIDSYGRAFMKVKYVQTTTAGFAGAVVSWGAPYHSITTGQEPVAGAYASGAMSLTDGTTTYTANQLIESILAFSGSTDNAYGVVRYPYANAATAAGAVSVTLSELRRDTMPGIGAYDGNLLTATASQLNTTPTATTKAGFWRPTWEVQLANTGTTSIQCPCGVLLTTVTAASGSTFYYTWMQIYGIGFYFQLSAVGGGTVPTAYFQEIMTSGTAGQGDCGAVGTAVTNVKRIVGYSLVATPSNAGVVVPAFIKPALAPPLF